MNNTKDINKELEVILPEEVVVSVSGKILQVKGVKGITERVLAQGIDVKVTDKTATIVARSSGKSGKINKGTTRAHLINMIKGVSMGWQKKLELVGAGYRAEIKDNSLVLNIGYSHPVIFSAPEGIKFTVEKSVIAIDGIDIEKVGTLAAKIRDVRPPDAYKGKGIRYFGEVLKNKPGKQAAKTEGGAK